MIFVNDFYAVKGIPKWLLHTEMNEDGMGFSDVIFPIFLVIVGMSIPFAIQNRKKKGEPLLFHIGERTLALLVMGFLLVNYEYMRADSIPFSKSWVAIYLITCFFLVWNSYSPAFKHAKFLKILGALGLLAFVLLFPGGFTALKPYWWGILGLIGWAYLWAALAYLWTGNDIRKIILITLLFLGFCLATFAGLLEVLAPLREYIWPVESGALPFSVMLGVLSSVFYQNKTFKNYAAALSLIGVLLIALGFAFRPYWGISKILATPAWICICGGVAYLVYSLLYLLVDVYQKGDWFKLLKPAGVATLTCYLMPYYWYAVKSLTGFTFPESWLVYPQGLAVCIVTSLIVIQFTGILIRRGIQLKV